MFGLCWSINILVQLPKFDVVSVCCERLVTTNRVAWLKYHYVKQLKWNNQVTDGLSNTTHCPWFFRFLFPCITEAKVLPKIKQFPSSRSSTEIDFFGSEKTRKRECSEYAPDTSKVGPKIMSDLARNCFVLRCHKEYCKGGSDFCNAVDSMIYYIAETQTISVSNFIYNLKI